MRLNQYLSHAGICSRRRAVELIKQGIVTVNGELSDHPAYIVQQDDDVEVRGKPIPRAKRIYLLLNKPKNYLCTLSDTCDRKTVIDLLGPKIKSRVYPVGRLDRGTTGLLILTNDGDLSQHLAHPKGNVTKVYTATLNADVKFAHFKKMMTGVLLEDGKARFDSISYIPGKNKKKC